MGGWSSFRTLVFRRLSRVASILGLRVIRCLGFSTSRRSDPFFWFGSLQDDGLRHARGCAWTRNNNHVQARPLWFGTPPFPSLPTSIDGAHTDLYVRGGAVGRVPFPMGLSTPRVPLPHARSRPGSDPVLLRLRTRGRVPFERGGRDGNPGRSTSPTKREWRKGEERDPFPSIPDLWGPRIQAFPMGLFTCRKRMRTRARFASVSRPCIDPAARWTCLERAS